MRIVSGRAAERAVKRLAHARRGWPAWSRECGGSLKRFVAAGSDRCGALQRSGMDLARSNLCRYPSEEMAEAWRSAFAASCSKSLRLAAQNIRQFCEWQKPKRLDATARRNLRGTSCAPSGVGGLLCAGRTISAGFDATDDRDSRAGGGREKHSRGVAEAVHGSFGCGRDAGGIASFTASAGRRPLRRWPMGPSIPRVDKIVGPGNAYVTVAKKLVSFDCAIDFLAGPTEAVVLSESGVPEFIAADWLHRPSMIQRHWRCLSRHRGELARSVSVAVANARERKSRSRKNRCEHGAQFWSRRRASRRVSGPIELRLSTSLWRRTTCRSSRMPVRFL